MHALAFESAQKTEERSKASTKKIRAIDPDDEEVVESDRARDIGQVAMIAQPVKTETDKNLKAIQNELANLTVVLKQQIERGGKILEETDIVTEEPHSLTVLKIEEQ